MQVRGVELGKIARDALLQLFAPLLDLGLGSALRSRGLPALPILLTAKVCFLLAFFVLAVVFGPFPDSDAPMALLTGFAGISGMAVQNAVQRVHLADLPPTTIMTGNTTQAVLDAVDLVLPAKTEDTPVVRAGFARMLLAIAWFAVGCAVAAMLYYWLDFWCLAVPVAVGAASAILTRGDRAPLRMSAPMIR